MLKPYFNKKEIEVGCDEAGRGCLAGPVFAAAVILPKDFKNPLLNDSKKLTHRQRLLLREVIISEAIDYGVGKYSHTEIDEINILNASFKSMHRAIDKLLVRPTSILVDGNRFISYQNINHKCIIKGDGIYASIAAASILAKTYRDEYMQALHNKYPYYNWSSNKGYPTLEHRGAIILHGPCDHHRRSFRLYPIQKKIKINK